MIFVETHVFTKQVTSIMSDDEYQALQKHLAQHPDAGAVIEGTGGLRKIRVAIGGRGKSGGARVIYYYFASASQIAMIFAYPKNVQATLTAEQKKMLKAVVENWR